MSRATALLVRVLHVVRGRFEQKDRGATAVEYCLMAAFIALVIIGAVTLLGTNLVPLFTPASTAI